MSSFFFCSKLKMNIGDFVWEDKNNNCIQDENEPGIPGVVLVITDEDGNPVTDVNGNEVKPVTTDENGKYLFENLPLGVKYVVSIDKCASEEALKGFIPTLENAGDSDTDSSLWTVMSSVLTEDNSQNLTLDFGFVTESEEPVNKDEEGIPVESDSDKDNKPEEDSKSGESAENGEQTGSSDSEGKTETSDGSVESDKEGKTGKEELPNTDVALGTTVAGAAMILLLAGGSIMFFTRRKN